MFRQSLRLFRIAAKSAKGIKRSLGIVLLLEAVSIFFLYLLNKQYGLIYQGIQDYTVPLIWKGITLFCIIAGILVVVGGFLTYFTNKLAFRLRTGLTNHYLDHFKEHRTVENIEQRIQEDLKNFGERSCEFWLAVLRSVVKLPIFLGVIVTLTQWWVGVSILFLVIIGTYLTKLVARKLIELQSVQESNEADFRKAIKHKHSLVVAYSKIYIYFNKINVQIKKLSFLQNGLGQMFVLLPFILLLPLYIAKVLTMGAFMQSVNALSKVIDSLTVLIDNRQLIVSISTCLKRMEVLDERKS